MLSALSLSAMTYPQECYSRRLLLAAMWLLHARQYKQKYVLIIYYSENGLTNIQKYLKYNTYDHKHLIHTNFTYTTSGISVNGEGEKEGG